MSGLSLYGISQTIADLIDLREDPLVTEAEREAIDGQIREWVEAEVRKVDNIRAYLKHCHVMQHAALVEAEEQKKRAELWENRLEGLKTVTKCAMESFGEKRLEGKTGVLRIQENGGRRRLKIKREDLIPNEYRVAILRVPAKMALDFDIDSIVSGGGRIVYDNDEAKIRAELERKCEECGGSGFLTSDEERRELATASGPEFRCLACNGTGHCIVPGAELEPRGYHLRVE